MVVDRLLLRDLPSHVNVTRRNILISTHLVVADSLLKLLNEPRHVFGILTLIDEPSRNPFRLQFLASLLDRFQRSERLSIGVGGVSSR